MDYKVLIEKAIEYIGKGFNNAGGKIENPSNLDYYLVASTHKAINFSRAIIILCEKNFNNESMPILRSLIEHTVNMKWIMKEETEKRLKQYLTDWNKKNYGEPWTNRNLAGRMSDIGFKNRDYYDFVVKKTYNYAHVNATTLDWGEVMNEERLKNKMTTQAIYSVIAQMLGYVLFVLNIKYKGQFAYYSDILENIEKYNGDIRKEFEAIISGKQV